MENENPQVLLPLDGHRSVTFTDRGHAYTYHFKRITAELWRNFFEGIVLESERVGAQRVDRFDYRSARIALVEKAVECVEGYKLRDGSQVEQHQGWRERLPYGHKLAAAEILEDVRPSETHDGYFNPEFDEVALDASWNAAEPGKMTHYNGLIHRFNAPTAEHLRRFNRSTSEARVVGGSRAGRTIYPGRQALLAGLYDQLIAAVDGYSVDGVPSNELAIEKVRTEMDTYHKVCAVQQLFRAPDAGEEASAA